MMHFKAYLVAIYLYVSHEHTHTKIYILQPEGYLIKCENCAKKIMYVFVRD